MTEKSIAHIIPPSPGLSPGPAAFDEEHRLFGTQWLSMISVYSIIRGHLSTRGSWRDWGRHLVFVGDCGGSGFRLSLLFRDFSLVLVGIDGVSCEAGVSQLKRLLGLFVGANNPRASGLSRQPLQGEGVGHRWFLALSADDGDD